MSPKAFVKVQFKLNMNRFLIVSLALVGVAHAGYVSAPAKPAVAGYIAQPNPAYSVSYLVPSYEGSGSYPSGGDYGHGYAHNYDAYAPKSYGGSYDYNNKYDNAPAAYGPIQYGAGSAYDKEVIQLAKYALALPDPAAMLPNLSYGSYSGYSGQSGAYNNYNDNAGYNVAPAIVKAGAVPVASSSAAYAASNIKGNVASNLKGNAAKAPGSYHVAKPAAY